ncbi:hypothetical protein [Lactiplantibacillus plantarum]|uniref:hypothetical protein n=1 Tax=Lactiplantibacillus plantarum TaxID=1590 RepID=UPI00218259CB|nr:hypothetical protein [Lactiplantibacillus plantarum]MCS8620204.1 hypothetical protein [Lactiplantibacillus plantarum]
MKSYYIESINLWIIQVNGILDRQQKDALRDVWHKQIGVTDKVVVLDETIAPLEVISGKLTWMQRRLLKRLIGLID